MILLFRGGSFTVPVVVIPQVIPDSVDYYRRYLVDCSITESSDGSVSPALPIIEDIDYLRRQLDDV